MTETAPMPTLAEVRGWVGWALDDLGGAPLGQVQGLFVDASSGEPSWLIAKLGRFAGGLVAIPINSCAGAAGRVWVAHDRRSIRAAPVVDPTCPLLREHELTISEHYGIGERIGRAAAVGRCDAGAVTSRPAP